MPCAGRAARRASRNIIQVARHHPLRSRSTDRKVENSFGHGQGRKQHGIIRIVQFGVVNRRAAGLCCFFGTAARDTTVSKVAFKKHASWSRPRSEWHSVSFRAVFRPIRVKKLFRLSPIQNDVTGAPQSPIPSESPTRMPEDPVFTAGRASPRLSAKSTDSALWSSRQVSANSRGGLRHGYGDSSIQHVGPCDPQHARAPLSR